MLLLHLYYIALVFFMLVFSLHLLLTRQGNRFLNRMLGILLLGRGLQYLYGWLGENGHLSELMAIYKLPNAIYFIAPAAYYLYIKGFVSDRYTLGRYEWLHFLPAGIGLYEALAWIAVPAEQRVRLLQEVDLHRSMFPRDDSGFLSPETSLLLRTGMFLVYLGLAWAYVLRSGVLRSYRQNRVGCHWVLTLLTLGSIGYCMLFYSLLWDRQYPELGHSGFLGSVRFSILIYACIMLFVFIRPRVMYGYAFVAAALDRPQSARNVTREVWQSFSPDPASIAGTPVAGGDDETESSPTPQPAPEDPAEKTVVSKEKIERWRQALVEHMEAGKPYLDPTLRQHTLSDALGIPAHHLSYLVNIEFGRPFNHWVNEYRVAHFMELYRQHGSTLTLEAIARQSGFSNRRTFYNAFQRIHGQPPGSFLQQQTDTRSPDDAG